MSPSPLENESGYSLVEVLAAILILSIAILPMVGMFDTGLRSASTSGAYDRARTLAQKELDAAQGGTYSFVRSGFPSDCTGSPGAYDANGLATVTGCADPDFPGFTFDVTKQYLKAFKNAGAAQDFSFAPDPNNNGAVQVTVTVSWGGKQYAVTGLKTR